MNQTAIRLKMLKDLSDNKDIKVLCDILTDYVVEEKKPMGFKGDSNGPSKEN